jgi:FAD:protein FMN transferase
MRLKNDLMKKQPEYRTAWPYSQNQSVHRFGHKAMNTQFEIMTSHPDALYAGQASHEAFCLLDRLEQVLSRFIPNSDISRINRNRNHPVSCSEDTMGCIQSSIRMENITNGYFNSCLGSPSCTVRKDQDSVLDADTLELDHEHFRVTLKSRHSFLDLGGIGKGYAVDRMAGLLQDWEIESALVHGGRSTVLVFGSHERSWPVSVTDPFLEKEISVIRLLNQSLSASGLEKGLHIINPKTMKPIRPGQAAWALAPTAVESDALSTAFMVMDSAEIETCCRAEPEYGCLKLIQEQARTETTVFGSFRR